MLSIVIPVYKEEQNIERLCQRLEGVLTPLGEYEIVFVLDPSPDQTEAKILEQRKRNPRIKLLVTSRRFGQPAATLAGIKACTGDACIAIDADMQDPPELIPQLVAEWKKGAEVVYARRRSRKGETMLKRLVSYTGYWVINRITDVRIPSNTGDFRLMSRRVIDEVVKLNESHGFLRGLVAFVGFKQVEVLYDRDERAGGVSKYNRFSGNMKIGLNGIICYSNTPLAILSLTGFAFIALALLGTIAMLTACALNHECSLTGSASWLALLVLFMGGIQLISVGLLGEYIGRIYDQTKQRPLYIIDRAYGLDKNLG